MVARCRREPAVHGDESGAERFSECGIHRVMSRQVRSQAPCPIEKCQCRITRDRKIKKSLERLARTRRVKKPSSLASAQHMEDLGVQKIGRGRTIGWIKYKSFGGPRQRKAKHELRDRRGIDDAQSAASRSRRMIAAGLSRAGPTTPGGRLRSRSRTSSGVGLAAISASSARRYSEREIPDCAARAFKVRWTGSGTSRTWTSLPIGNRC